MSNNILASSIGTICARCRGLFRLVLPRTLPPVFKKEVCSAIEAANGVPVLVGDGEGEHSAGEAIAFRTPEGGSANRAIVLIVTDGQARELKSLETFRDLLTGGMPGGPDSFAPAILRLDDIALEVAQRTAGRTGGTLDVNRLSQALNCALVYLANAYRETGNDEKRWTDAFWQHADLLVGRLPETIRRMLSGKPGLECDAVFASAGLPRPGGPEGYTDRNDPKKYTEIVAKSWSSQEEIKRSLIEIDLIDTGGSRNHPLLSIAWREFPSTRASHGHPLLAVAYHGADQDDGDGWLHGWASTSEAAFFGKRDREPLKYELYSLADDGETIALSNLGWRGLDHVLPPGPTTIRDDGKISLGRFRLRLVIDIDVDGQPDQKALNVKPASSCRPEIISVEAGNGCLLIDFELSRRAGKNGGKWREKPFTLSISPSRIAAGLSSINDLSLKLSAPHPARPTAIAVEHKRGNFAPLFPAEGRYEIESMTGEIKYDCESQDISHLKLRDGKAIPWLAVVGSSEGASWVSGENLVPLHSADPILRFYALMPMPEDAVIDLASYQINVQAPEEEGGQVNPIFASILGEPVVPADNELRDELLSDPRGLLEQWHQEHCISARPSLNTRSCLGTIVIETSGHGNADLVWNPVTGTFANTASKILNLRFPWDLANSPEANAFWEAFDDLDLGARGGAQQVSAWPSALDLREISDDRIDRYLSSYFDLLKTVGEPRVQSWLAYPFSALLYNQGVGEAQGVLLSPLHPLRLAWAWSVQQASDEIAHSEVYGRVASLFLRFVDGELLPLSGPSTQGGERWAGTGLAPGPQEFFAGWTLLTGTALKDRPAGMPMRLMGLSLPFGTPSGLDHGGVAAALRDYMRVFPASPELRIGLAAPRSAERFPETDEAIIAASGDLVARSGGSLPGGVRIFDASNRQGRPPSPVNVLGKVLPDGTDLKNPATHPPFEWVTEDATGTGTASKVDIQFIEDTVVRVRVENIDDRSESIGTSGPALPFSRYRSWRHDGTASEESSFALGIQKGCFGRLQSFARGLGQIECLQATGAGLKLTAALRLGADLLGDHARWTITGNRHLDPSALSSQLRAAPGQITLWEWRPAFLSRQNQRGAIASVTSTHPYTVLARPSRALSEEIASVLQSCGMGSTDAHVKEVVTSLGVRGVGLSSLLTMGHKQSLGAIGFSLAFKALRAWESHTDPDEVRCVLPMDAVYPLLDILGKEAKITDDQRRADLLLLSVGLTAGGPCTMCLHPVEVKMRSGDPGSFPLRKSVTLKDPLEQLATTHRVLDQLCQNHAREGHGLSLVNAALATLLEAALSLRPATSTRRASLETRLLRDVAGGAVTLSASRGTLLWFQAGATGAGGGSYEKRSPGDEEPGQVLVNPAALDDPAMSEIGEVVASIVEKGRPAKRPAEATGQSTTKFMRGDPAKREDLRLEINVEPEPTRTGNDSGESHPVNDQKPPMQKDDSRELSGSVESLASEGISILVGSVPSGTTNNPVYFKPSETVLNQLNIGVVGDLGTGKTQFLKSLVYQLSSSAASNRGHAPKVFIFDYKRDYTEGDFPEALGVKLLDPLKRPLPINFFALGVNPNDRIERVRRSRFFCDLLQRISGIGQVQSNNLYKSVMTAYEACAHGHAPSINDVFDVYSSLGKNDSVVSVLTLMRDIEIFEPAPQNTTTFANLFDRNTVLNLSGLGEAGQDIVDIVATMFLDHLYTDYMKSLPKEDFIDGPDGINRRKVDSFVLIDEAHHAMERDFEVLMKLMLEGREFGMGVILSSQFLSHFYTGKHDWTEALSTWIVHNVRHATPKQFEKIGFRRDVSRMVQDVAGLEPHWAYYRCVNGYNEGILMKGQPFHALTQS